MRGDARGTRLAPRHAFRSRFILNRAAWSVATAPAVGRPAIAAVLFAVLLAPLASAAPPDAQAIFATKCAVCHTIGKGKLIGPDLKGVTGLRDKAWLTRWLSAPDQVLAAHDSIATALLAQYQVPMPNPGLTADEVQAMIGYLATVGAGPATGAVASVAPVTPAIADLPEGNSVRGRSLYTGVKHLTNGGPPCLACHTIAGIGALGGGALGPDHTTAYQRLGPAVLTFPQTGTMLPIYGPRPLTPAEQADLLAFLRVARVSTRSGSVIWGLLALAALGVALLFGAAAIIWRHRLEAVRVSMVRTAGMIPSPHRANRTES